MCLHVSEAFIKQGLLLVTQGIVVVEPTIAVEFGQFQTDFVTFLWGEPGEFLKDFGLAHTNDFIIDKLDCRETPRPMRLANRTQDACVPSLLWLHKDGVIDGHVLFYLGKLDDELRVVEEV
jgi:hypothetical protein